jgi:Transferrin
MHTTAGYQKTSGWTMPVGTLFKQGVLKSINKDDKVPNDIEAIKAFFGKSCAGSPADVPSPNVDSICTACKGNCSQDTTKEAYTDYPGAFACLKAGAGDIAFTKEGVIPAAEAANYKLVCPDGTTAPLAQYETCNLAVVPSHSVVRAAAVCTCDTCIHPDDVCHAALLHSPVVVT